MRDRHWVVGTHSLPALSPVGCTRRCASSGRVGRRAAAGHPISPGRALAIVLAVVAALGTTRIAAGQDSTTEPARQGASESWNAATALSSIHDFSFSYAQPGFYALLRRVKAHGLDASEAARTNERWTDFLERPADFRGQIVHLRGTVGGNRRWKHESAEYADLGYLSEMQLTKADEPIICKVILSGDASDIPLGAIVDVDAYFVTIQHYYGESKRQHQAAVFVGQGPSIVSTAGPGRPAQPAFDWTGPIVAATAGLLIAYLILRRSVHGRRPVAALRASREAPLHLADELAEWTRTDDPLSRGSNAAESPTSNPREAPPE